MTGVGPQRHASPRRLEPHQPATGRRDPDRSAPVVAVGDRNHPRGHGRRRPAAGATGRAVEHPRVGRGPEPARLGGGQDPVLGQSRLAHDHEPGVTQAPHQVRVALRLEVAEQVAAHGQRHPGHRPVVLDGDRHPGKRPRVAGGDRPRRLQRRLVGDVGERVDGGLERVDPVKGRLDELEGGQLAAPDERGQLDGGTREQLRHGPHPIAPSARAPRWRAPRRNHLACSRPEPPPQEPHLL